MSMRSTPSRWKLWFDRSHDRVVAVVIDGPEVEDPEVVRVRLADLVARIHRAERLPVAVPLRMAEHLRERQHQAADLGRHHPLGLVVLLQQPTDPALALGVAVQGSGVVVADAHVPGVVEDLRRLLVGDRRVESRQRRHAESQAGDLQRGATEPDLLEGIGCGHR